MRAVAQKKLELVEYERLDTSKLAFRYGLDRATVRKRLLANGIEPIKATGNESVYELSPVVEAILGKLDDRLDEAKLRAITADAELREAKVLQMRGELISTHEVTETMQQFSSAVYKKVSSQPKRLINKLRKAKTQAQAEKIWIDDINKIFGEWRTDFERFLA